MCKKNPGETTSNKDQLKLTSLVSEDLPSVVLSFSKYGVSDE
jgi:hypothetical protein